MQAAQWVLDTAIKELPLSQSTAHYRHFASQASGRMSTVALRRQPLHLGRFGLRFGSFDFIEDHDGKITFLECNANGQYRWLEQGLGFPISNAITDELARIADSNV